MIPETKTALARTSTSDFLPDLANAFYQAKRVERVSSRTLAFYRQQLGHFLKYCDGQVINRPSELTAVIIRQYLLWLEEAGHNPGGVHAAYRTLKTFLRWYDLEMEPEGWRNPINKVKPPRLDEEPLDPVEVAAVQAMAATCSAGQGLDLRDRAILLSLLDTGARAREFLAIDLADVDLVRGEILIRRGKGGKPRTVFFEQASKRAIRAYLKQRIDNSPPLWVSDSGERLGYSGLRLILIRRARLAGVGEPEPHAFRRACALRLLRRRVDLQTIARVLGHASLKVLQRYLKQLPDDIRRAYEAGRLEET